MFDILSALNELNLFFINEHCSICVEHRDKIMSIMVTVGPRTIARAYTEREIAAFDSEIHLLEIGFDSILSEFTTGITHD